MEEIEKYSKYDLEQLPYRVLQQVAKSMSLPSNVKKVYLIQLIYTKTHKTPEEVAGIIQRVKYERQMLTQTNNRRKGKKKMRLQATEVSSTNSTCMSPPIDLTPKRAYSPEMPNLRTVIKYYPPTSLSPKNTSDRVLRSYNVKSYKRPNYSLLNNSVVELVKSSERAGSPKEKETQISIVSHEGRLPRLNVTARCVMKKYRPTAYSPRSYLLTEDQVASVNTQTKSKSALVPAKRVRTVSGIYPIPTSEARLNTNYEFFQSIGFRRTDGKMSKINALIQKPAPKINFNYNLDNFDAPNTGSSKNVEVTIQDIINSNIDSQTFSNPYVSEYTLSGSTARPAPLSDVRPSPRPGAGRGEINSFSVYYHKKIRAEQVRSKRSAPSLPVPGARSPALPTISRVFSRFSDTCDDGQERISAPPLVHVPRKMANTLRPLPNISDVASDISDTARDVTQPICVQVSEPEIISAPTLVPVPRKMANELRRLPNICDVVSDISCSRDVTRPIYVQVSEEAEKTQGFPKWSLEGLYNLKSETTQQGVRALARAHAARCVYSAPTVTTAVQLSAPAPAEPFYPPLLEPASQCAPYGATTDEVSRMCIFNSFPEQDMTLRRYHEVLSASTSSLESQTATIPEMVEDALEIISQDGDYMERIGMDVRMQCILCSWAGSKIILEYHIRKEHSSQITQQEKNEWNVTYKLGSLVNQDVWLSHVCERDNTLYILSVKYEDPDCLMASLSTLSITDTEPKLGTITLYNKVSGEPYSWHGQIPQLPSNMPYENDPNCLKIELSKLELLPNSANIKLHNRELVLNSPTKVVVGQPELNDIHVTIFVKIHEA